MTPETDYYAVLGVDRDAEPDQIRKAFRERVRACHPDRVANLDEALRRLAEEKMVELNEAYAVLRNPARRAAYDDRRSTRTHQPTPSRPRQASAASQPVPASPLERHGETRNRIGEQRFVARAAAEEFQQHVKQAVSGNVRWSPVALPGTTLTLHGARGRKEFYFALLAAPRLDEKLLRRLLARLESWAATLKPRLWGRDRVYGFAGAVEFEERERLRRLVDQFNRRRKPGEPLGEATLIDLVNWHVAPGDADLQTRLRALLKEH